MAGKLTTSGPDRFRLAQNSEINVTPFVDVMLVLLIIFMVAIPAATSSLKLDLPLAHASAVPVEPTYVSLQRDGSLFLGDKPTSLATLSHDLAVQLGGAAPGSQQICVRADRAVRYGAFVEVVDRLQADGYRKVGLISEAL